MMILSAWNEHDEGHWIEPALAKYGGAEKLEAIKRAIDKAEARRDVYWARVAGQAQESAQEERKETAMKHDDGLAHALVSSSPSAASTLPKVGRMGAILAGQPFRVEVKPGGAAVLTGPGGEHLTTLTSSFSEPVSQSPLPGPRCSVHSRLICLAGSEVE